MIQSINGMLDTYFLPIESAKKYPPVMSSGLGFFDNLISTAGNGNRSSY